MASRLAHAHIEGQRRLRLLARRNVGRAWRTLPGHDEVYVPDFVRTVVPVVLAVQHQSATITNAFIAESLDREPLEFPPPVGALVRGGAAPEDVYRRPFVTYWTALSEGKPWQTAWDAGLARAESTAAMDVQLSMRGTLAENEARDDRITGYERVPDGGACDFCASLEGARVGAEAMPVHNNCGCGAEPLTEPFEPTPVPEDVGVEEHGELGPVLVDPDHNFDG